MKNTSNLPVHSNVKEGYQNPLEWCILVTPLYTSVANWYTSVWEGYQSEPGVTGHSRQNQCSHLFLLTKEIGIYWSRYCLCRNDYCSAIGETFSGKIRASIPRAVTIKAIAL